MMFPDLLTYAPVLQVEFHLSLPQDLLTSLRLLRAVDQFEGLSDWVYQTAAILPAELQVEADLLGYPVKWCFRRQDSLIWRLPPSHPAHTDMDAFVAYLKAVPPEEFQRLILYNLAQDADLPDLPVAPDNDTLHRLLTLTRRLETERWGHPFVALADNDALVALIQAPQQLKARLIGLLTRFWDEYYAPVFEAHVDAIAHSVAYHRQQDYPRNFTDLFRQVTGRSPSLAVRDYVQSHLAQIERVIFCPCAHLGLYFQITLSYPTLVVAFNYRTTPARQAEGTAAVELFPPLKALADESRLHILSLLQEREMYAQEIVEAVGLSQSTVSRHLQLLERTELVDIRQERGMKFYSINRARGQAVLKILEKLIG